MAKCPICNSPADLIQENWPWSVECDRCGIFKIEEKALITYNNLTSKKSDLILRQIAVFTGWIREHQTETITERILNDFRNLKPPSLQDRATKLLKKFSYHNYSLGGSFNINFDVLKKVIPNIVTGDEIESKYSSSKDLKYMAITWSYDIRELQFIYEDYLKEEKEYLTNKDFCKITPKGWAYLESLRQPNPDSKKAFVAMWFEPEMEKIYDGFIKKAIEDAGYEPIQIGRKEHNDDINDAIIGEIRSSKFVVADFTGNRGGVYYEAGFAYGLNIPVIYTCKKDQLKNVHFDVNHRNIIDWKDGDDLYEQLLKRIKATIT